MEDPTLPLVKGHGLLFDALGLAGTQTLVSGSDEQVTLNLKGNGLLIDRHRQRLRAFTTQIS